MSEDPGQGPDTVPPAGSGENGSGRARPDLHVVHHPGDDLDEGTADEVGGGRDWTTDVAGGPDGAGLAAGGLTVDGAAASSHGPPGAGIFSLEGRPAPGLYVAAWLLAVIGIGLFVVAGAAASSASASNPVGPAGVALFFGAFIVLTVSLASAAGYQVLARADRRTDRYRGPSPLILLGAVIFGVTVVVGLLSAAGLIAPESQSIGALVDVALTTLAYLAAIWLFVVRTHALDWPAMGWPAGWRISPARLAGDLVSGVAMMVPTYVVTILVGGVIASLLGAQLPSVLPAPRTPIDTIATVLAAVVIAPIGEESFFRGLALTAWWRDLGLRSALLRATVFFAIVHILNVTASNAGDGLRMAALQFIVILPVGYVLGWLFSQRGIMASIAGHMTFNGIAVVLLLTTATIQR